MHNAWQPPCTSPYFSNALTLVLNPTLFGGYLTSMSVPPRKEEGSYTLLLKSWREILLTYRHNPSLLRSACKNLPSSITLCLVIGVRSITILRRRHKNCSPATPHNQHMFVEGKEQFWSSPWVWDPQIGAKNLFLTLQKLLQNWHPLYRRRTYIENIS